MPFWESSAFWGIASIATGAIVSILISIIGKEKRLLEYHIDSFQLIKNRINTIPEIGVTFDNQPVENLILSKVKFSNMGNKMITPSDFATLEPLGMSFAGHFFTSQNGFQCIADNPNSLPLIKIFDDRTLLVEFDFLNPKQSFEVTVLHDDSLTVIGDLKAGKVRGYRNFSEYKLRRYLRWVIYLITYVIAMFFGAISYIVINIDDYRMPDTVFQPYIVPLETLVITIVLFIVIVSLFLKILRLLSERN